MGWLSRIISFRSTEVFTPPCAPTDEQIRDAETELGLKFPAAYLAFLRRREPMRLGLCATFPWIGADSSSCEDIVEANRRWRKAWGLPAYLVVFFDDGSGNLVCFDARKPSAGDELPIVFWDHELPAEENIEAAERQAVNHESRGIVATSFTHWLETELAAHA